MKFISALRGRGEILVIIAIVVLVGAFAWFNPVTSPPDETAHLAYPRTILLDHQLPAYDYPWLPWESHQPPLYYLLSLPLVWGAQHFSFVTQLELNRLTSIVLIIAAVWIFYRLGRRLFPSSRAACMTVMSMLMLPMVLYMGTSFSNDILVIVMSGLLWLVAVTFDSKLTSGQAWWFGGLVGLALLTKVNLFPMVAVVFLYRLWRQPWQRWIQASIAALAISGWWFVHNIMRVGDLLGLKHTLVWWHNQQEPITTSGRFISMIGKLAASLIGVFGKFDVSIPVTWYGLGLAWIAVLALRSLKQAKRDRLLIWLWVGVVLTVAFVIYQNTYFFQPQGRYLFALIPALAIIMGKTVADWTSRVHQSTAATLTLTLFITLNLISLNTLHRYFQIHAVRALTHPRSASLMAIPWHGDRKQLHRTSTSFTVTPPATVFTAADLRLDPRYHPRLKLAAQNNKSFRVRIDWMVLGQTRFREGRSVSVDVSGQADLPLPEKTQNLIQEIRLSFEPNQPPVTLTAMTVEND